MIDLGNVAKRLKADFYLFFLMFWNKISGDKFVESRHIKFICDELQELGKKIIAREKPEYDWYIINVPPGSTKSSIASVAWEAWLITNDNSLFIINTSYSYALAVGCIRKSKQIFDSTEYREIFGKLELSKDLEYHFETKGHGGRYAASTGGPVTGVHGDVIVSDDPLSVEDSFSKAKINRANRFNTQTLVSRKRNKEIVPQVLIMQRLNENDPAGHILSLDLSVKHICLPAELSNIATNPELYTDGLLDPVRMNKDVLSKFKALLGGYGYAGQFDQRPAPEAGGIIKRHWFEIVTKYPETLPVSMYIDGAYTKNTKNDPTGIMISCFDGRYIYVIYYTSKWMEMPELLKYIKGLSEVFSMNAASRIRVEPKASGKTLCQLLSSESTLSASEIIGNHVNEGKQARASASSPSMEAGRVKIVKGSWNDSFLSELAYFPNAKHDEAVDCLCYDIYDHLIGNGEMIY